MPNAEMRMKSGDWSTSGAISGSMLSPAGDTNPRGIEQVPENSRFHPVAAARQWRCRNGVAARQYLHLLTVRGGGVA